MRAARMKIAFIGQKGIPALSGGVEKHVQELAVRMAASGHEVTAYVRSHYTPKHLEAWQGVRLVHLPSLNTKHLDAISHALLATLHAVFLGRYDIVHYHSIGPSVLSFIPRLFRPGVRVVATFHSRDYFHQKWNAFARACLRAAEFFTCWVPERTIVISESLRQYAEKAYGRGFVMIPNGADVTLEPDTTLLKEWGLRPERYVLAVSRLVRHKGLHYLVKAFRELETTGKLPNNMKLVIAGAPAHSEEYAEFLRMAASASPNILLVGEQTGRKLAALFSHAALFVQPSEDEGLSLALLEAMAYGRMALVSDIAPNLEAIGEEAGDSFANKDVPALREKLAYYLNRPEALRARGEAARHRALQLYSWNAIAKRTLDAYRELMDERCPKKHFVLYRHR